MSLKKLDVYPLHNYSVMYNGEQAKQETVLQYLTELKQSYEEEHAVQRSVEGVLVTHLNHHPHIIVLKQSNRAPKRDNQAAIRMLNQAVVAGDTFRLPGGRCRKGESEEACLLRKLGYQLLSEDDATADSSNTDTIVDVGRKRESKAASVFRVGELISKWHRPLFSPLMYPYIPPHIAFEDVKETRSIFLIHLESVVDFQLRDSSTEFVAVPLFDLYENTAKYGPVLASLPSVLSKVSINYCNDEF
ncbi:cleavage and polyadenylation specificity factor subunit 5 [Angomonas deanei]|uniref:Cleavage and polyadenylation specificity factor subunit 5 n=1 Tax=Angomonas deanei TaxID=59799 RepID=S9VNJ2_9TRYP|nr:cleavage and polyadenylation specificity factor subunit 5 [Angomonas deanei]EPY42419.1 cleavage and polyadenylation specificity factor subunit 5 [Angomonas deanei]CAD2215895.1 Nucleotide hydrolase, putative [Angomonas deanei]|eukprot:EPY30616.1 cleavage and polyadenylation specificity factor subunit 5 [Angomonas deanei]